MAFCDKRRIASLSMPSSGLLSGSPSGSLLLSALLLTSLLLSAGCSQQPTLPAATSAAISTDYLIGPGDSLQVFVWRNPEVSTSVIVRPDGKLSTPLVEDLVAAGKTPTQLARDVERELANYLKEPLVTIMVSGFVGPYSQQVRVVGEAGTPQVLAYREHMSVLDVMIAVGGLTEFAAGNNASIVRNVDGQQKQFGVRLDDLIREGDISANVPMLPGDILIIPESWF